MKAALVQADKSLKVEECPKPEPGPGEVLIKVAYCGICGSDLHMLGSGLFPAGAIIGHEFSGHIAALGEGVTEWKEGAPAIVMPLGSCMTCEPCKRGDIQVCQAGLMGGYGVGMNPGGFTQYMVVKSSLLYRVPDGMDMKTATLNEPWSVAVRGVNQSKIKPGEHALVMGAGPIGLLCIFALKNIGAEKIFVSEPDPYRAERALSAGAVNVFNPKKENPGDKIQQITGNAPDYIFECAGTEDSMQEAALTVRSQGHIVMLGVHQGNVNIFPMIWFMKEISINFSMGYSLKEFGDSIDLLSKGVVNPNVVISDVVPLDDIGGAFKALHGSGHMKILVDCG